MDRFYKCYLYIQRAFALQMLIVERGLISTSAMPEKNDLREENLIIFGKPETNCYHITHCRAAL